jgi:hypothetical protein
MTPRDFPARPAFLLLLCAATLALAGCGASAPPVAADLARRAGCANPATDGELPLLVAGQATCDTPKMTIHIYADNATRDAWLQVARQFANLPTAVGDRWTVQASAADIDGIAGKLGGKVEIRP